MDFERRLDQVLSEALPGMSTPGGRGGRSVGLVKPSDGGRGKASGSVLKRAEYPQVGTTLYLVCTIDGTRQVIAIEETKVIPDFNHPGTQATNPPPFKTGNRASFKLDDVLLGSIIGNNPPLPVIEQMEETLLYDWGLGTDLN